MNKEEEEILNLQLNKSKSKKLNPFYRGLIYKKDLIVCKVIISKMIMKFNK